MRTTKRANLVWALAVLVGLPLAAAAQAPKIELPVGVGLPDGHGPDSGRTREGAWMPVYVKINAGPRGFKAGDLRLVVEAPDVEETLYRNTLPLPALQANEDYFAVTYLRTTTSEFKVRLEGADGRIVPKSESNQRANNPPLRGDDMLCLSIGISAPAGLRKSLVPPKQPANQQIQGFGPGGVQMKGGRGQPVPPPLDKPAVKDDEAPANPDDPNDKVENAAAPSFAHIGTMRELPDRWYGYDAVDVVFLTTDSEPFLKDLLNSKVKVQALAEWVRRGGKLVVSVGNKADLVAELLQNMPLPGGDRGRLIDCDVEYNVRRRVLRSLNPWAGVSAEGAEGQLRNVTMARLVPGRGTRVLLTEPAVEPQSPTIGLASGLPGAQARNADGYDREARPLVVDAACGLGRVMLVAFDLDSRPFTAWPGQQKVWEKLRAEMVPGLRRSSGDYGPTEQHELMPSLRSEVETFGDVPTVHFGWVALFIVIYILIVGPLDYFLLAKVFKRLELTWLTFPTVVLTLSVGAYFGAYALKGDTRRMNKIDVVEIDVAGQQAYGTSWFAVFSPRIENYTLGVEPIFPGLAPTPENGTDSHSAVVTVLESTQVFDTMRTGSSSLFNRPYDYAPAASGLEKVPIPVWSIRSFTASWRTPLTGTLPIEASPGGKDPEANTLALDRDRVVIGTIKNNLPVTLKDITLFYYGKAYRPPGGKAFDLAPGASFPVFGWSVTDSNLSSGVEVSAWENSQALVPANPSQGVVQKTHMQQPGRYSVDTTAYAMPPHVLAKQMFFFNRSDVLAVNGNGAGQRDNAGLRRLDQMWRLQGVTTPGKDARYLEEVILVARTEYVAQDDSQKVNEKSLVRLWSGELPKAGTKSPPLVGQTTENTFVRAYIPVRPRD